MSLINRCAPLPTAPPQQPPLNSMGYNDMIYQWYQHPYGSGRMSTDGSLMINAAIQQRSSQLPPPPLDYQRDTIRRMTKQAFDAYATFAWGHDTLDSINFCGRGERLGATIFASLSTLVLMDMREEVKRCCEWIDTEYRPCKVDAYINVNLTVINTLGSLLSCYKLTNNQWFMSKAFEVAEWLEPAYQPNNCFTLTGATMIPQPTEWYNLFRGYRFTLTNTLVYINETLEYYTLFQYAVYEMKLPNMRRVRRYAARYTAALHVFQSSLGILEGQRPVLDIPLCYQMATVAHQLQSADLDTWLLEHFTQFIKQKICYTSHYDGSLYPAVCDDNHFMVSKNRSLAAICALAATEMKRIYYDVHHTSSPWVCTDHWRDLYIDTSNETEEEEEGEEGEGEGEGVEVRASGSNTSNSTSTLNDPANVNQYNPNAAANQQNLLAVNEVIMKHWQLATGIIEVVHRMANRTATKLPPDNVLCDPAHLPRPHMVIATTNANNGANVGDGGSGSGGSGGGIGQNALLQQSFNGPFSDCDNLAYSYFVLWRLTHKQKYRDYAWQYAQAIERHCRHYSSVHRHAGYASVCNVNQIPVTHFGGQCFTLLSSTFKFLYLIFCDDDVLPLDQWVFNQCGHPLPRAVQWRNRDAATFDRW